MTSDERIEIAARLRKTRGIMAFVDALGIDLDSDWTWEDVSKRVAGLIDPTCHVIEKGHPDESHVCYGCNTCDFGWHEDVHDEPYAYCPNCGARLVERDER